MAPEAVRRGACAWLPPGVGLGGCPSQHRRAGAGLGASTEAMAEAERGGDACRLCNRLRQRSLHVAACLQDTVRP